MERYVFDANAEQLQETFGVEVTSEAKTESNFNAAPGHNLPIIIQGEGAPSLITAQWGSDIAGQRPVFVAQDAFNNTDILALITSSPCIIPISGFYKWKRSVEDPYPFYIRIHTRDVLGIAGYFTKDDNGKTVFTALVTEANVLVKPLDTTMPAIISPNDYSDWLNGNSEAVLKKGFADHSMLPEMTTVRVPELVNDLSNNSKALIQPIPKLRDDD